MSALAGAVLDPGQNNIDVRKVIAWGRRTTASSGSTGAAVGVLQLDSVPVLAGHLYAVHTNALILDSTVNNDVPRATIRYTTDGSTAIASSTVLPGATLDGRQADAAWGEARMLYVPYEAAADGSLSLLLCIERAGGSGTCIIHADGTSFMIDLLVSDLGISPGNTGVSV